MNILFICSKNKWRSRTAETIFKNEEGIKVKSAGIQKSARIQVSQNLMIWAELIFVMENKHKKRIVELYRDDLIEKEIIVLDIPDDYQYMDKELIEILKESVPYYLKE